MSVRENLNSVMKIIILHRDTRRLQADSESADVNTTSSSYDLNK